MRKRCAEPVCSTASGRFGGDHPSSYGSDPRSTRDPFPARAAGSASGSPGQRRSTGVRAASFGPERPGKAPRMGHDHEADQAARPAARISRRTPDGSCRTWSRSSTPSARSRRWTGRWCRSSGAGGSVATGGPDGRDRAVRAGRPLQPCLRPTVRRHTHRRLRRMSAAPQRLPTVRRSERVRPRHRATTHVPDPAPGPRSGGDPPSRRRLTAAPPPTARAEPAPLGGKTHATGRPENPEPRSAP